MNNGAVVHIDVIAMDAFDGLTICIDLCGIENADNLRNLRTDADRFMDIPFANL